MPRTLEEKKKILRDGKEKLRKELSYAKDVTDIEAVAYMLMFEPEQAQQVHPLTKTMIQLCIAIAIGEVAVERQEQEESND